MATPRKVRLQKRLSRVLTQLFDDFPNLQWFRNVHDNQVHIARTSDYMAHWSDLDGGFNMDYLTIGRNGPVIYYGRGFDERPWMFASNTVKSSDPSVTWLISVEETDYFMVAVLNTLLNIERLMPTEESTLFRYSFGLSNCEVPDPKVINWLQSHNEQMPALLQESCDRARLYRM